jgi:hypothetical protein
MVRDASSPSCGHYHDDHVSFGPYRAGIDGLAWVLSCSSSALTRGAIGGPRTKARGQVALSVDSLMRRDDEMSGDFIRRRSFISS